MDYDVTDLVAENHLLKAGLETIQDQLDELLEEAEDCEGELEEWNDHEYE